MRYLVPARPARLIAASLLLAASACSFAPQHVRPPQPVPDRYPSETAEGPSIAQAGWRDFFPDAELRRLIGEALANNRDIRVAAARVAEARAAWRIEGASLYPQLDAVATGTRGRSLFNLPEVGATPIETRQISAQLSASWEIDFWGRLRALRDAARWQYLATEESRRAVATDLVAQVANGYLLEREYGERSALARASIDSREETLRIMRRRYEVGSGSKLDMTQAQTLLAQARMTLQALEQDRAVNRNALALLVGHPIDIAPGSLDLTKMADHMALPPGLPSDLLANRPDIMAAEDQLRAANANIGAARAAFFPNISLTGAYGTMSDALDGLFADGSKAWSFAPRISLPLFNAGRLKGNLGVAEARRDQAVAEYERTVQSAFRDVSDALVRRRQLGLQVDTTREMLQAQRERARLAQLRFDNGRSAYLEVLDAQRDLFDAEQTLAQLRRAEIATAVALYSALGGGFVADPTFDIDAAQNSKEQAK
ncbi:efflux transporter outer membrane subunit [Novosphingobium sp. H3SJ31-1]|uniref:Efflux transporter outer membrane subunit n=1 Tax=Novosphingobium album (ex Liu et al. 2023) TaxID=3031130 RepID=A0ABT5WQF8_9SPHN|nr:efflux transporter outer membrane subunit [Novosphingobium album (ex Liu et al. 2023)]MDE8652109.1 efflux transporter outer membrane subunit [Novosphingobium album (ex Liu et al. 2023)]